MRRRTTALGWYGKKNLGDDVFERLVRQIEWNGSPVQPLPLGALTRRGRPPGWSRLIRGVRVAASERLVFFGGSTLRSYDRAHRDLQLVASAAAVECSAFGVSVGPFQSAHAEAGVRSFLNRFSFLVLRDHVSFEWCRANLCGPDIYVAPDPVALLPSVWTGSATAKRSIGVSVSAQSAEPNGLALSETELIAISDAVAMASIEFGAPVAILELCDADRTISERLFRLIVDRVSVRYVQYGPPDRMIEELNACAVVVSSRLHGGLLGAMTGADPILLAYSVKHRDVGTTFGLAKSAVLSTSNDLNRLGPLLAAPLREVTDRWDEQRRFDTYDVVASVLHRVDMRLARGGT